MAGFVILRATKRAEPEDRYDAQFMVVFDAIRELMEPPPEPKRRPVGYLSEAGE